MRAVRTDLMKSDTLKSETEKLWVYNGLDCCVTVEVLGELLPQLDNLTSATYSLSRELQGPVLEMNMRGVLIDEQERQRAISSYRSDTERLERQLYTIVHDGVGYTEFRDSGKTKAWRSNDQIACLLYDILRLPEVRKRNAKGELVRTVERNALEKLQVYFLGQPIISHILSLRDIGKKIGVLETEIDPDGRLRTSYNIVGTTTGRFSSSLNDFGTGGNVQNIEERLRRMFIPDAGYKFANIDLEQADARNIGALCWNIFRDPKYLDACESGDLHTAVSKLSNPELPWTGDLHRDKEIADSTKLHRHHSVRHMNKVLGHGTTYLGGAWQMSRHTKIEQEVIEEFQPKFFGTFPAIPRLHEWIWEKVKTEGHLITPFGRKRWFFGRRDDKETLKQAVAHMGQSMTADEMNYGLLQLWREGICQILLQCHDSLLIQFPEDQEDKVVPAALAAMKVTLELEGGRQFTVPLEAQVGWNWGKLIKHKDGSIENPWGLSKWPDSRGSRST